jgi:hypothetical protein
MMRRESPRLWGAGFLRGGTRSTQTVRTLAMAPATISCSGETTDDCWVVMVKRRSTSVYNIKKARRRHASGTTHAHGTAWFLIISRVGWSRAWRYYAGSSSHRQDDTKPASTALVASYPSLLSKQAITYHSSHFLQMILYKQRLVVMSSLHPTHLCITTLITHTPLSAVLQRSCEKKRKQPA